mmetsp:Transcript_11331/g.22934  ORF Transcript_11331/g.22934 Transcript_11331/m.22934 type:complete len:395 (+) Transcript_11331:531-1715(+)
MPAWMRKKKNQLSKRRFLKQHLLRYGLEIATRSAETSEISSVRCKFCVVFGREHREEIDRRRKVTNTIKYFKYPFRPDNYCSHLRAHGEKWEEYKACSKEEQKVFFDATPEKFVNTLAPHFDIRDKDKVCLYFDINIIEDLVGGMLFDLNDEEDCISKEKALSMFELSDDLNSRYTTTITNTKRFELVVAYISVGSSFRQVACLFQVTKDNLKLGYLGSIHQADVISYARILVAFSLQGIKDLLSRTWCYSVAFDGSTHQHTSYLDIRARVYHDRKIKNIHVIALPMFARHTGEYMYNLFRELFDILDPLWKQKLVGVTTDGARSMTGTHRGAVTRIQNDASQEGFYRIWCALHQLDIVVQKCITKYFNDKFYNVLTAVIGYLRRQQMPQSLRY